MCPPIRGAWPDEPFFVAWRCLRLFALRHVKARSLTGLMAPSIVMNPKIGNNHLSKPAWCRMKHPARCVIKRRFLRDCRRIKWAITQKRKRAFKFQSKAWTPKPRAKARSCWVMSWCTKSATAMPPIIMTRLRTNLQASRHDAPRIWPWRQGIQRALEKCCPWPSLP